MQFSRYLTHHKSSAQLNVWPSLLKVILAAASFYYVISKVVEEQVFFNMFVELFNSVQFGFLFFLVVVLMTFNWLLESKKWQILASQYQDVPIQEALKAILRGVSLDAILPFGAGAVSSKVLSLSDEKRQQLIAPIILAQAIQSFWTVFFGAIGIYQLAQMTDVIAVYGGGKFIIVLLSVISLIVIVIIKFRPNLVKSTLISIHKLPRTSWAKITLFSLIRYVIFFVQLLLLCMYLAPEIPVAILIGCISWMFFAKTIVPKPGHLGALGIRGASVVFFLNLAGYAYGSIVVATLVLWVINLAIPSLVGLFFMKDLKLRTVN